MNDNAGSFWGKVMDRVSPYSKRGLEGLTALVILIFSMVFSHIFIIPLSLLENLPNWFLYLTIFVIFCMLVLFLFSSDILYYGDPKKNRYVRAFQEYWPSKHISKEFNLEQDEASHYWFENFFNTWRDPNHPRHSQWERTLRRGSACRFVYYCIKFFEILLWISVSITLLQEVLFKKLQIEVFLSNIGLGWKIFFIILITLLYVFIRATNRTSPEKLTGAWRQYAEINKMHIQWIDDNIQSLNYLKNPGRL